MQFCGFSINFNAFIALIQLGMLGKFVMKPHRSDGFSVFDIPAGRGGAVLRGSLILMLQAWL
jgi:hypothetical protein